MRHQPCQFVESADRLINRDERRISHNRRHDLYRGKAVSAVAQQPAYRFNCAADVDVLCEGVSTTGAADGPEFDVILVWISFNVMAEDTSTIKLHHHFVNGECSSRC